MMDHPAMHRQPEPGQRRESWLDWAEKLTAGARRAHEAGDCAASIALATAAAECIQIHKLLAPR